MVIEEMHRSIVLPNVFKLETITSDFAWRAAIRSFISAIVDAFASEKEPNCYFAELYRHEAANRFVYSFQHAGGTL